MSRVAFWEAGLAALLEDARARPFLWGANDCATFAFDVRACILGRESDAVAWRGRYTTALGAQRVMRRLGWASLEEMGRDLLGEPRDRVLMAQRGDIVLSGGGVGFGVCVGSMVAGMSEAGLVYARLSRASFAWKV